MRSRKFVIFSLFLSAVSCGLSSQNEQLPLATTQPCATPIPPFAQNPLESTGPAASGAIPNPNPSPSPLPSQTVSPIRIENFYQVDRAVFRGARPDQQGIQDLKRIGIKAILSLEEYILASDQLMNEQQWSEQNGMSFLRVPMNGVLQPQIEDVRAALELVLDASNQPIFVHCLHGSDRTGIVIAAYHIKHDGWTVEQATTDMQNFGHSQFLQWWDDILRKL